METTAIIITPFGNLQKYAATFEKDDPETIAFTKDSKHNVRHGGVSMSFDNPSPTPIMNAIMFLQKLQEHK